MPLFSPSPLSCSARSQRGFTLLEVLLALGILSLALTGVFFVVGRAVNASQHARKLSQATLLAQQKMAELDHVLLTRGFAETGVDEVREGTFFNGPSIDDEAIPRTTNTPFAGEVALKQAFASYRWRYKVERLAIPDLHALATEAQALNPLAGSMLNDNVLGLLQTLWDQRLRKVTLEVLWNESSSTEQRVELVRLYTDTNGNVALPTGSGGVPGGTP